MVSEALAHVGYEAKESRATVLTSLKQTEKPHASPPFKHPPQHPPVYFPNRLLSSDQSRINNNHHKLLSSQTNTVNTPVHAIINEENNEDVVNSPNSPWYTRQALSYEPL